MLGGGQGSDTVTATFLDEGKRTIGVWLPLALADIEALLTALIRMQASNPQDIRIPSRSEALSGWCLPMMSRSLKAAEEERKAKELFDSVVRLAEKQKAKNKERKEGDSE